jgi:hypothetical protein
MNALAEQFCVGWVEPLRDPTRRDPRRGVGDVGSREELDPTYDRADEVIE